MTNKLPIEIDVRRVKQLLDDGTDFLLLDCREQSEHDFVQIDQAVLIPMSELQTRVSELGSDHERHIVVHCHHGGRSLRVTNWLRGLGFANAQNMTGGIDAWSTQIDASKPRYE